MLILRGLTKTYAGNVRALVNVNLDLPAGMFGLLGPNGAGKTTLMKILATLLEPDAGSAVLNGTNLITDKHGARLMLGYLPQEFGFYPTLTAVQMLDYFARLKGVGNRRERANLVEALLERVNLSQSRKQRLGEFSGGMRQRLGIAQALIGQPQLIIVDEPTAGLDPEERIRFHNLLAETAGADALIILSTHIVSDVSSLCSRMAIIRRGEILATTAPRQALNELAGCVWEANVEPQQVRALKAKMKIVSSQMSDGSATVRVISSERPTESFQSVAPTLEDYYLNLVREF